MDGGFTRSAYKFGIQQHPPHAIFIKTHPHTPARTRTPPMKHKKKTEIDPHTPFIICSTLEEFQRVGKTKKRGRNEDVFEVSREEYSTAVATKETSRKEDIVVPHFEVLPRPPAKHRDPIPANYIRTNFVYPLPNAYELKQSDLLFLKQLQLVFPALQLLPSFLAQEIIALEQRCGRQTLERQWEAEEREAYGRELSERAQGALEESSLAVAERVFDYWLCQRRLHGCPLYPPLWRPARHESDPLAASRPREAETRTLRKSSRLPERQLLLDLYEEITTAAQVCRGIVQREQLKLQLITAKTLMFQRECGLECSEDAFLAELDQNMQRYGEQFALQQEARVERGREEECDPELSLANFLANVVDAAHRGRLIYDVLFPEDKLAREESRAEAEAIRLSHFKNISSSLFEDLDSTDENYQKQSHSFNPFQKYFAEEEQPSRISHILRRE